MIIPPLVSPVRTLDSPEKPRVRFDSSGPNLHLSSYPAIFRILKVNLKILGPGNTKGGNITVPLTSCLTGLESAVCQLTIFVFICKQTNPNQLNRRQMVQYSLPSLFLILDWDKKSRYHSILS